MAILLPVGLVRTGLGATGFTGVWADNYEASKKEMRDGKFDTESHEFVLDDVAGVETERPA